MGQTASQTLENYVESNNEFKAIVKNNLEAGNRTSISSTNANLIDIQVGHEMCCPKNPPCIPPPFLNCNLDVSQSIGSTINITQSMDASTVTTMMNELISKMAADLDNKLDQVQKNDPLAIANSVKQDIRNKIIQNVRSELNLETSMDLVNEVLINTYNSNTFKINMCSGTIGTGGTCKIDQNITTEIYVKNILSAIANTAASNKQVSDFYAKVTNAASQKQEGAIATLADMLTSMVQSLGAFGISLILLPIALIIFIVIGVGAAGKSVAGAGGGGSSGVNVSSLNKGNK